MQYKALGKTGLMVSEIGYGAEHLVDKSCELVDAVVNTALDGGVNIIDVFMPQSEVRSNIGKAIGKRRKSVMLQGHIGATLQSDGQYHRSRDPEKCDVFVKDFLTRFDTDYIDFGIIHYVDTEDDYREAFDSPYIEYVRKLKEEGVVRFLGASTHDATTGIKMVNTGLIDMIMFSINPAFDLSPGIDSIEMLEKDIKLNKLQMNPIRVDFYNLCAAKGVGITVMKALGAGRLLHTELSNMGYALTLPQCVSYALDRPAVSSVLLGAQTVEEIEQALSYEDSTPVERNYTLIMQNKPLMLCGKCMYCNHCLPCPQSIDVAAVMKYLDMARVSDADTVRGYYNALTAHGGNCVECGGCESNCPFGINVIENMKEAERIFGK